MFKDITENEVKDIHGHVADFTQSILVGQDLGTGFSTRESLALAILSRRAKAGANTGRKIERRMALAAAYAIFANEAKK